MYLRTPAPQLSTYLYSYSRFHVPNFISYHGIASPPLLFKSYLLIIHSWEVRSSGGGGDYQPQKLLICPERPCRKEN
jgi:hypothetical protein